MRKNFVSIAYLFIIFSLVALAGIKGSLITKGMLVIFLAGGFLALASLWDIKERRIPNKLNLIFAITMLAVGLGLAPENFQRSALSGLACFAIFLVLHLAQPKGLGMGDVKLAFGLGTSLGWFSISAVFAGFFVAILINALASIVLILFSPKNQSLQNNPPKKHLPFAPALAAGSLTGLICVL